MKILIDLHDDHAEALRLLSVSLGRRSRHQLIVDILTSFVDNNPEMLEKARRPPSVNVELAENRDKRFEGNGLDLSNLPIQMYIFTRKDGEKVSGRGRTPQEALFNATGQQFSPQEYEQEFKSRRTWGSEKEEKV